MTAIDKLIARFSTLPKDFTWEEIAKRINIMDYLEYKGYRGSVEYSKEDDCLCGKVLGMSRDMILYEGETLEELRADFEAGIDSYLAGCEADGILARKPYSGSLNIRIPSELHSRIAMLANDAGTTINGFIRKTLEDKVLTV